MTRIAAVQALALVTLLAGSVSGFAQTDAQKQKIKLDCRSDFMKLCSGVQPGGIDALKCLESHMANLSAACQSDMKQVEVEMPE